MADSKHSERRHGYRSESPRQRNGNRKSSRFVPFEYAATRSDPVITNRDARNGTYRFASYRSFSRRRDRPAIGTWRRARNDSHRQELGLDARPHSSLSSRSRSTSTQRSVEQCDSTPLTKSSSSARHHRARNRSESPRSRTGLPAAFFSSRSRTPQKKTNLARWKNDFPPPRRHNGSHPSGRIRFTAPSLSTNSSTVKKKKCLRVESNHHPLGLEPNVRR